MTAFEPISNCPSCGLDLSQAKEVLPDDFAFSFCPSCQFPLLIVADKYQLERLIGEGGTGRVYLARHIRLFRDRERVVKVLRPELFQLKGARERFEREVQITSSMSRRNEHIVSIYDDFGHIPKFGFFFVMEYLHGQDLHTLLQDPNVLLPLEIVSHIFFQICDAVAFAHAEGIIHRDLKPENIFIIEREGDPHFVKVIDFGIAKTLDSLSSDAPKLTRGPLGTPAYMSPEQCANRTLDHRSDIYSLGIILYEMLVGHTPYLLPGAEVDPKQLLVSHLFENPTPPSEMRRGLQIPPPLEDAVMRSLERDPNDRFSSVLQFREVLERAFSGESSGHYVNTGELNEPNPRLMQHTEGYGQEANKRSVGPAFLNDTQHAESLMRSRDLLGTQDVAMRLEVPTEESEPISSDLPAAFWGESSEAVLPKMVKEDKKVGWLGLGLLLGLILLVGGGVWWWKQAPNTSISPQTTDAQASSSGAILVPLARPKMVTSPVPRAGVGSRGLPSPPRRLLPSHRKNASGNRFARAKQASPRLRTLLPNPKKAALRTPTSSRRPLLKRVRRFVPAVRRVSRPPSRRSFPRRRYRPPRRRRNSNGCPSNDAANVWVRVSVHPRGNHRAQVLSGGALLSKGGGVYCVRVIRSRVRARFSITTSGFRPCRISINTGRSRRRLILQRSAGFDGVTIGKSCFFN